MKKISILLVSLVMAFLLIGMTSLAGANATPEIREVAPCLQEKYVQGMVYRCEAYGLKASSDTSAKVLTKLTVGTTVHVLNLVKKGNVEWCYVEAAVNGVEYSGYIQRKNLMITDEVFLAFEESREDVSAYAEPEESTESTEESTEGTEESSEGTDESQTDTSEESQENSDESTEESEEESSEEVDPYEDIYQFPESYQEALKALKDKHPNWVFVPFYTNVDWEYAVSQEMVGVRSLIQDSYKDSWKKAPYGSGWSYASESAVRYFMDPRNWLQDNTIFQFEQLTYNASYHNAAATQSILKGSFMEGLIEGYVITYPYTLNAIGAEIGVSPFHLASRLLQEQGRYGTSELISGTYPGYENLYNYFNFGAAGQTRQQIVENGLKKARAMKWTNRYDSLYGGSQLLADGYIRKGQDTLYLQKYDVDNSYYGMFSHQYMQNVGAAAAESKSMYKGYVNAGIIEGLFAFKIPVYLNMPKTASPSPDIAITETQIHVDNQASEPIFAELLVTTNYAVDLEYRWLLYSYETECWEELAAWDSQKQQITITNLKSGDYLLQGEVRVVGSNNAESVVCGMNYVNEKYKEEGTDDEVDSDHQDDISFAKPVEEAGEKYASYQGLDFYLDQEGFKRCYSEAGEPIVNQFACDGEFTYYFQLDGTCMRNRLTYHPDGEHILYFDEYGHEVFSNFANVKVTMEGAAVDDYCFFDVYGFLYVNVITYDQTGTKLYYANEYGVMEHGKWFRFSDDAKWADGSAFDRAGGDYGYAMEDCSLMTNQYTYDTNGNLCYMQGNGVAKYN